MTRLAAAVARARSLDPAGSRTARLLKQGRKKAAKKVVEEAAEVGIEGAMGRHAKLIVESADLLYNLAVLWAANGVSLPDIAAEMQRREVAMGIAEKWPKHKKR